MIIFFIFIYLWIKNVTKKLIIRNKETNHRTVLHKVILKDIIKKRERKKIKIDPDQIAQDREVETKAIIRKNQKIKEKRNRKNKGRKKDKEVHLVVQAEGKKRENINPKNQNLNKDRGQDKRQKTIQILRFKKKSKNKK